VSATQAGQQGERSGTLERGLRLLQFFAAAGEATPAEAAKATGLSRSATYRIADRLRGWGFLEANPATEALRLGSEAVRLGMAALASLEVTGVAPPHLRRLADQTQETVNLAVVDGDQVVYIHKEEGTLAVKMSAQLGSRRPLHCTALGKAWLAALPAPELEALLAGLDLARFTAATITDPAALAAELDRVRRRGWATDEEEVEEGVYCLGAAIRDHRRSAVAAISVAGPAYRLRARADQVGALVAETAAAISRRLGHR
jgi:IclR family transcriptional regulator, acetate operon repressor